MENKTSSSPPRGEPALNLSDTAGESFLDDQATSSRTMPKNNPCMGTFGLECRFRGNPRPSVWDDSTSQDPNCSVLPLTSECSRTCSLSDDSSESVVPTLDVPSHSFPWAHGDAFSEPQKAFCPECIPVGYVPSYAIDFYCWVGSCELWGRPPERTWCWEMGWAVMLCDLHAWKKSDQCSFTDDSVVRSTGSACSPTWAGLQKVWL